MPYVMRGGRGWGTTERRFLKWIYFPVTFCYLPASCSAVCRGTAIGRIPKERSKRESQRGEREFLQAEVSGHQLL